LKETYPFIHFLSPQGRMLRKRYGEDKTLTRFDPERIFKGEWNKFMEKVPDCIDCGECEERCPYDLPIRKRINEAAETYGASKKSIWNSRALNISNWLLQANALKVPR
jgi:NAD-dependent dihydropyrimidine dehydrogenase PreA subunit